MYFTLLFDENPEGPILSYDLIFSPCPDWFQGRKRIGSPNNKYPYYEIGHLGYLLNKADFKIEDLNSPRVGIVCHENGHGREEDLNLLISDLESEGFEPRVLS